MLPAVQRLQREDLPRQRAAGDHQHPPAAARRGRPVRARRGGYRRVPSGPRDSACQRRRRRGGDHQTVPDDPAAASPLAFPARADDALIPTGASSSTGPTPSSAPTSPTPRCATPATASPARTATSTAAARAMASRWSASSAKYPKTLPDGGTRASRDRINGCMARSMNGRPLPEASREMQRLPRLSRRADRRRRQLRRSRREPGAAAAAAAAPDPVRGRGLYLTACAACHRGDGAGMRNGQPGEPLGYLHPPLWGPDSFNAAAGMQPAGHRRRLHPRQYAARRQCRGADR